MTDSLTKTAQSIQAMQSVESGHSHRVQEWKPQGQLLLLETSSPVTLPHLSFS